MDKRLLLSPRQIGESIAELFWRSGNWLLWLLTVVVAGLVGIGERFSVKNISNHAWFRVAVAGAIVSLAVAYHRARLERDVAHAKDVRPDHLADLQHRLGVLLDNIESGGGCDYQDIEYSLTNQLSFKAHYSNLEKPLDDWDAAVYRVVSLKRAITTELEKAIDTTDETAPWFGIRDAEQYDVGRLQTMIQESVERRSADGILGNQVVLNWREQRPFPAHVPVEGPDPHAFWKLEIGGQRSLYVTCSTALRSGSSHLRNIA